MTKTLLLGAVCAGLMAGAASAQTTAYTNKATFLAAAGSTQTETFSSAPVGAFASTGGVFNATFDGFKVTGQNNGNYVGIARGAVSDGGPDTAVPAAFVGQNYLTWANIGSRSNNVVSLTINFNAATTAFGFDWFDTDVTDSYNVAVAGGQNYNSPPFTLAGSTASTGFFGLTSSTPFTSIVITNNRFGGYVSDEGIDNLITNGVGSVNNAVPEPATWAMMIAGFGMVGFAMRRRRKVSVSYAA